MPRRRERLSQPTLGAIVVVLAIVLFFGLLLANVGRQLVSARTLIRADFPTGSGLRKGGPVRLAGVVVGKVKDIRFAHVRYACDPLTEDFGRIGDGRTDDCDVALFCTAQGWCGRLEPWAGKGQHAPCITSEDCAEDETCVTSEFRNHFSHVEWSGPVGVCARAETTLWRASVYMDVQADALALIRADSRAMISSASALGDLLVDISPGRGGPLGPEQRIQSRPSVFEDIDRLRERVDRFTAKADDAAVALVSVIDELRDEATISALEGFFFNIEVISRDLAQGRGVLGALLGAPRMRSDLGKIFAALRRTSEGFEASMQSANRIAATIDRNAAPIITDADHALREIDELLVALQDPANESLVVKLLRDPEGTMATDLAAVLANTGSIVGSANAIMAAIVEGRGTLGKLIQDPHVAIQIGRFLSSFAQRRLLRWGLELILERNGYPVSAARSAAGPPR